jgi:type IV secretion system protein VirB10
MDEEIFEKDRENQPAPTPPADRGIPSVATVTTKQYILGGAFLAVAAVAIIFVVIDGMKKNEPKSFVQAEEIAFKNASGSSAPYIEPEPLPPEEELQPAQSTQDYDPLAAQRELAMQQEALRMAQEQKRRMEQRIASPQLIYDQSGGVSPASTGGGQAAGGALLAGDDPNTAFANQNANLDVETATASQLQNLHSLIAQGTMIGGILETAIQSDLPGMVRAVISEDVFSFDGSHLLIPKGSKLVGRYRSGVTRGQSRVFVIWNRLIRNDGVSVNIGSYGTDALGRSGLEGEVDTHFFERFGSSVLLSMIDAGLKIGVEAMDDSDSATVALEAGDDFSRSSEIALENSIDIPPTIHVDQGVKIKVFVGKDLDFSQVAGNIPRE